ncbi:mitochondrial calcium uniporter regulator 1 isoform X1 [Pseudoliparis swirei]|uniref:mitochondrial calcium uniporter regulator 1 isoform X1 n=1 Tax=Pseudoliparis swirei TaxID=2059687 RepID=UPI0024BE6769|nr:mitochondrial calcium uniporter regulator 1 isoform X1 [Pseudoliparis swirei]
MLRKQCHSQLKRLGVTHPEERRDLSFTQNRVCSFVTASNMSGWTPRRSLEKPLWRGRRAALKVTRVSARGLSINAPEYLKPDVPRSESGKLFFDTHAVVRLFEENGFTTRQAEAMVKVLVRMTMSNMDVIYNDMVTKVQQKTDAYRAKRSVTHSSDLAGIEAAMSAAEEIMLQHVMSQIAAVKKDMVILEKSEFTTLLAEYEKLKIHIFLFKVQLDDVMNKVRSDTIMDLNLEKSRAKGLKVNNEKRLLETRTEIMEMTAEQDRHLSQTNMKIDTELAGLKTMLESHKLDTIKYLAGSVFTCLTVVLGFYRIWM